MSYVILETEDEENYDIFSSSLFNGKLKRQFQENKKESEDE